MPVVSLDEFGRRTSDPALQESGRQSRLLIVSFDGTLAGGLWSSKETVVPAFIRLIDERESVVNISLRGCGTDGSWEDYLKGAISGWGTLRNVCHALEDIAKNYRPGDRIIILGYSRGAWAGRYLARLISEIGLPKNGDRELFHRIYKASKNHTIFNEGVAQGLLEGHERWDDVEINALCCFDTVGSLGLPVTGLAKPLSIFRRRRGNDIISDVAPNVNFAFHALSLHELREPFFPTLMRGSQTCRVYEVSFPGTHGNLGWISDKEGLVHAPLAWMVQQVHTHLHIRFNEVELARRFPSYYAEASPAAISDLVWFRGAIDRTSSAGLAIYGKKPRQPGHTNTAKVHIGARLRNTIDKIPVPGYNLMTPVIGHSYWERKLPRNRWNLRTDSQGSGSSSSTMGSDLQHGSPSPASNTADRIEEAEVGPLEARLLGLPQEVVRRV